MLDLVEDRRSAWQALRVDWQDKHTKAEVAYQQIVDQIALASQGTGAFPTPTEVYEAGVLRYTAQEALDEMVIFIEENKLSPEVVAQLNAEADQTH